MQRREFVADNERKECSFKKTVSATDWIGRIRVGGGAWAKNSECYLEDFRRGTMCWWES